MGEPHRIVLTLENGETVHTTVQGVFEMGQRLYVALTDDNSDALFVYRVVDVTDSDFKIEKIPTEEELDAACKELDEIIFEMYKDEY